MLVIYKSGDRNGNQLVSAAMMIAAAEEYRVPYYYTRFQLADKVNNVNGGLHHLYAAGKKDIFLRVCRRVCRLPQFVRACLRLEPSGEHLGYAEQYVDDFVCAAKDSRLHLWGFWFFTDFKALFKHQDEVRRRLSLKQQYTEAARRVVEQARTPDSVVIAVHVRRTDYKTFQNGRLYFSLEQYREWMQQCVQASPKPVRFVVCSDERLDEASFSEGFEHVTYSHESFLTDMAVLSLCDYMIGPPSTFSGYASFIGKTPKFSLNGAASRISSLDQFRVYMVEYTDIFAGRESNGRIGFSGPNSCIRIQNGILGEPVDLMQDIDSV